MNHPDPFTSYLRPHEHIVLRWRPSWRLFLMRLGAVFMLTFVVLLPLAFIWDVQSWAIASFLLGLAYLFALDDLTLWAQLRHQEWALSNQSLLAYDGGEDITVIPLDQITDARVFPPWALSVDLESHRQIRISCPPAPRDLQKKLVQLAENARPSESS